MLVVPLNAAAPLSLTLRFQSPTFNVDLTTVTAVSLQWYRRDGTTATFAATIMSATPKELVCQYTFAGGELTTTGLYYIQPLLSVPGGQVPVSTVQLFVDAVQTSTPILEESAWVIETVPVPSLGFVHQTWNVITPSQSPYSASVIFPWIAADLRTGDITVNLPSGVDGDSFVISDVYDACNGMHQLILNAFSGQSVPALGGSFTNSALYNQTFQLRLKYNAAATSWFPW